MKHIQGYFTDPDLLGRVPNLLLILAGIYLGLGLVACLLITQVPGYLPISTNIYTIYIQPPATWLDRFNEGKDTTDSGDTNLQDDYVTPLGEAGERSSSCVSNLTFCRGPH